MNADKPRTVDHAEWALWAWTAWVGVFGIYQTLGASSGVDKEIADQLQAIAGIPTATLRTVVIAGYVLASASMAWVVFKIGAGKNWARLTVLVSFILEALWVAAQSDATTMDYLADVPDFGLQMYALYLLYTEPGRQWFRT
jgi:hypothetical protein